MAGLPFSPIVASPTKVSGLPLNPFIAIIPLPLPWFIVPRTVTPPFDSPLEVDAYVMLFDSVTPSSMLMTDVPLRNQMVGFDTPSVPTA